MGRHAEGWKLVWRNGYGHVRFTHDKARYFISTGERDPSRAAAQAAKIYAEVIGGKRRRVVAALRALQPLETLFAEWLAALEGVLDEETVATYARLYVPTHFVPFFRTFDALDESRIDAYARARLREVLKKTLQKELGALRGFLRWCKSEGFIEALPVFPEFPKTTKGRRSGKHREKANDLTEEQVVRAIVAMPIVSARVSKLDRRLFPVRARFAIAYETGLRPATLDALSIPEHWQPGSNVLRISDDIDKARFGRDLELTATARGVLEQTVSQFGIASGPIFGRHDYRTYLRAVGLDDELRSPLAAYDFRHARGTHLVDRGASLSGVAYQLGHTQVTTVNKYAHPTKRAGDVALQSGGADLTDAMTSSGAIPDRRAKR